MSSNQKSISLFQNFIEEEKLTTWATHFADVARVYIQCLDLEGNPLTDFVGNDEEKDSILELLDENVVQGMLERLSGSALEDIAVEDTGLSNLKLAVITTRVNNKPVLHWLMVGVLNDSYFEEDDNGECIEDAEFTLSENQFYATLDALNYFSQLLIEYRMGLVTAEAESRRSRNSEEAMSINLRRAEALTDIVQLLENEDPIEKIMLRMLEVIGRFLGIERNVIYRIRKDAGQVETLAAYSANQVLNDVYQKPEISALILSRAIKPLVYSNSGVMSFNEKEELADLGIKALMVLPLVINGTANMYACFYEKENEKTWSVEEIKFINDSVKILQSILVKRVQKNSIARSYESIETILDNVGSAVYVKELNSNIMLFANNIMKETFSEELRNGTIDDLISPYIDKETGAAEFYHREKDKFYDLHFTRIKWVDGSPVMLCALYDISEKKAYQKKIEQQAYTDFLTGLYNRMCCERDLAKIIDESERTGKTGAILYLDLDDFKHINDSLGHQYGDVLLKAISHSVSRIPGIEGTCYRMGGDEFVIVIPPESFPRKDAIVEDIKGIFAKPWFLKDADYYCTMSMGIVEFPEYGTGVHDLIKKADIAMYEAKKSGKNRMAEYSDGIDSASGKRLDMEKNMRDATNAGFKEFEVYFQPIVDITLPGNPCYGAEALIRWNSIEMGFISPAEFIPLAEYLGLINPIGNYVLYDACNACRHWNDSGYPGMRVSVNLSVVQLLQNDVVKIIEDTLKETGINPANLTLEVTESLAINDMDRMKKILAEIKKLGVKIALDDFGTGYSSLNHIREIPFDVIKVDQSFIRELATDSYAGSFVKMVGELAEAIGVKLCVEGVETVEQLNILRKLPVDYIQGYYFDKPMTQSTFETKYMPELLG